MNKWKADKEEHKLLEKLIGENHPQLVELAYSLPIIFKDKSSKNGGRISLGRVAKAPDILNVLNDTIECQFFIEIGFDLWNSLEDNHRVALLDHLLSHIKATENEQNGEMVYSLINPDVSYFEKNLAQYNNWQQEIHSLIQTAEEARQKEAETKKKTKGKQQSLLDDSE